MKRKKYEQSSLSDSLVKCNRPKFCYLFTFWVNRCSPTPFRTFALPFRTRSWQRHTEKATSQLTTQRSRTVNVPPRFDGGRSLLLGLLLLLALLALARRGLGRLVVGRLGVVLLRALLLLAGAAGVGVSHAGAERASRRRALPAQVALLAAAQAERQAAQDGDERRAARLEPEPVRNVLGRQALPERHPGRDRGPLGRRGRVGAGQRLALELPHAAEVPQRLLDGPVGHVGRHPVQPDVHLAAADVDDEAALALHRQLLGLEQALEAFGVAEPHVPEVVPLDDAAAAEAAEDGEPLELLHEVVNVVRPPVQVAVEVGRLD